MTYQHPLRGSCVDASCPMHGCCHCGCGLTTNRAVSSQHRFGYVKGQPNVFVLGHGNEVRICPHGHDKNVMGRTKRGGCRECERLRSQRRHRAVPKEMLPSAPLRDLIASVGTFRAARCYAVHFNTPIGSPQRFLARMNGHIEFYKADEWCTALGTHVSLVYPECY